MDLFFGLKFEVLTIDCNEKMHKAISVPTNSPGLSLYRKIITKENTDELIKHI
jgi:hypothetical protein